MDVDSLSDSLSDGLGDGLGNDCVVLMSDVLV